MNTWKEAASPLLTIQTMLSGAREVCRATIRGRECRQARACPAIGAAHRAPLTVKIKKAQTT
jgi:hypothetical protein